MRAGARHPIRWLIERVGGWPRARVILILAAVLGLDGADKGAIGAMAEPLQKALGVGKTEIGFLLTVSLLLGALCTLPFGWLVDRVNRTRLLMWMVGLWGISMFLNGTATSYLYLLFTRLLLSGVTAAAGPAVASLIGDYFPIHERGRIYGYVLAGEFVGTGIGFGIAGELAVWTWRAGFIALGIPAFFIAWALHKLKEPARGGESRMEAEGAQGGGKEEPEGEEQRQKLAQLIHERHLEPRGPLLFTEPPRNKSLWWAFVYVLRIPTNDVLITASALGYYFLSGVRTFAVEYLHKWFDVSHGVATLLVLLVGLGALGGVLFSGRLSDSLIARGHLRARVKVAVTAYLCTCGLLFPALLTTSIWLALGLLILAGFALGSVNPPLDAARLDIMHPGLWGRAESIRTLLRQTGEAFAPLAFGYVADHFFGAHGTGSARGLHYTFLVMLVPLGLSGLIGLIGLKTYGRDVATAQENTRRTREGAFDQAR